MSDGLLCDALQWSSHCPNLYTQGAGEWIEGDCGKQKWPPGGGGTDWRQGKALTDEWEGKEKRKLGGSSPCKQKCRPEDIVKNAVFLM